VSHKVLTVHNRYLQQGGEDAVFEAEVALLRSRGHAVLTHEVSNGEVESLGTLRRARATVWNAVAARELAEVVRRESIDVVHFHNTFPLISPAALRKTRAAGAAVVQTLHNFRLICPGALLMRDGRPCEDCVGRAVALPGIVHACYRESRIASAGAAAMVAAHRALGTWRGHVDAFIALTAFAREKFVAGGLPADRLHVKPNFVTRDPGVGAHRGGYFLFVGRLTREKGPEPLLAAWRQLQEAPGAGRGATQDAVPLWIVGDGPLAGVVREAAAELADVKWLGSRPHEEVLALMQGARALIVPSIVYENFPLVVAEAYATGLPVLASDLGSLASVVEHGRTGLRFVPQESASLAAAVRALHGSAELAAELGRHGRSEYEARYTPARNYDTLLDIYGAALTQRGLAGPARVEAEIESA
jgi:glycosyltransferase involved in cell wall biosynthesis